MRNGVSKRYNPCMATDHGTTRLVCGCGRVATLRHISENDGSISIDHRFDFQHENDLGNYTNLILDVDDVDIERPAAQSGREAAIFISQQLRADGASRCGHFWSVVGVVLKALDETS